MGIILPTESNLIVLHGDQPVIGDGHAMRVSGQVVEHMLGPPERLLGIYHPVVTKQRAQEHAKDLRFCQVLQPSLKDQFALVLVENLTAAQLRLRDSGTPNVADTS